MKDIPLPTLPDGSPDAVVEHVYVAAGEQVRRGQQLALVRTERFVYDIPVSADGTLLELHVAIGERLSAGQTLAVLDDGEHVPAPEVLAPVVDSGSGTAQGPPLLATPLARRIAGAHALDLARVRAGNPRLLRRHDVLRLLDAAPAQQEPAPAPMSAVESESGASAAPCALTVMELDWSAVDEYLARGAKSSRRSSIQADRRSCLVSATASALLGHRRVHAAWSELGIVEWRPIDIRIGELTVRGAADLSPVGVARALAAPAGDEQRRAFVIVEQAQARWSEAALPGGAAAVLCVGHAETQLRVAGDSIVARPISLLALVYDTRVLDQRSADAFLADLRSRLERIGSLC